MFRLVRRLLLSAVITSAAACAHRPDEGPAEALKRASEAFHHRIRWRDLRGAAELVAPEKRDAFERARRASKDERDLSVTDYQLEQLKLDGSGQRAEVISKVGWMRLPSVTESTEEVVSRWELRAGSWVLAAQEGGPFPELAP